MQITGYNWGSAEFNNALKRYSTKPPEYLEDKEFFDPVAEAELQAECDESLLWNN